MRCKFCGYPRLSKIKIWEDKKTKATFARFGCFSCGRKFDVELKGDISKTGAPRISPYAKKWILKPSQ